MLVTEISYPLYRAPLTSTYNSLWYSGAIVYVISPFLDRLKADRFSQCCLVHIWFFQDPKHLGMATAFRSPGPPLDPTSFAHLVRPRVSSLVD